jgi:uncharacterized DUF497 family protein
MSGLTQAFCIYNIVYPKGLNLRWTWDQSKAQAHLKTHGLGFELALPIFEAQRHLTQIDPYPHEERWQTIGAPFAERPLVLFVVHTELEDGGGRIISARKATPYERKAYEKAQR